MTKAEARWYLVVLGRKFMRAGYVLTDADLDLHAVWRQALLTLVREG